MHQNKIYEIIKVIQFNLGNIPKIIIITDLLNRIILYRLYSLINQLNNFSKRKNNQQININ